MGIVNGAPWATKQSRLSCLRSSRAHTHTRATHSDSGQCFLFEHPTRLSHVIFNSIPSMCVRYTNARYFVSIFRADRPDPMIVHACIFAIHFAYSLPSDNLSSTPRARARSCLRGIGKSFFIFLKSPSEIINSIDVKFG